MSVGKLGCLDPHPEGTHPRVKLATHMTASKLPPTPAVVDYSTKIRSWPMYLNDRIGDCTCAGIAHSLQAWTAYAKGLVTLPDSAVLRLYEAFGYRPGQQATDRGAVEQDVLAYVQKHGIGGHKILAYAQVDHRNLAEMKAALNIFGSVYLGAQMPGSAMAQTNAGLPWTISPGSAIEGGHAFVLQRYDLATAAMEVITWGQRQRVTESWWIANGQEAWVMISQDWFLANGKTASGIALPELGDEFSILTGQDNPLRTPAARPWYCLGLAEKAIDLVAAVRHPR